jgi:hypothetical protein
MPDLTGRLLRKLFPSLRPERIYFARDGVIYADHTLKEAIRLIHIGKIPLTDHYWHEGMAHWRIVSESNAANEKPPPPPQ